MARETLNVPATVEIAEFSCEINTKPEGLLISCSRQLVAGGHRAGLNVLCANNPRSFTNHVQVQTGIQEPRRLVT